MHHPLWVVVVVGVVYRIGLPSYTSQGKGRQGMGGSFRKQPPRLSTRLCPVVKCPHLCTSELASEGHSVTGAPGVPGVPGYIYIYIYIYIYTQLCIYINMILVIIVVLCLIININAGVPGGCARCARWGGPGYGMT